MRDLMELERDFLAYEASEENEPADMTIEELEEKEVAFLAAFEDMAKEGWLW